MSQISPHHLLSSYKLPPILTSVRRATTYTARIIRSNSSGRQISVQLDPSNLPTDSRGHLLPRRDLICHICNLLRRPSSDPLLEISDYLQTLTLTLTPSEVGEILKSLRPPRKALAFFHFARTLPGYSHDCFSFNRILAILARSDGREMIGGVVEEMEREGVRGNVSTLNILIGVVGGRDGDYERFLELGRKWGLRFNGYTYKCLLQACLRWRDVERAVRVYEGMCRRGFKLDIFAYNMLLDALAKADKVI